jgi:hypothetical protein
MGAPDVLGHLRALGLTLAAEGGNIIVRPRQALTDEARQLIKTHKAGLLAALAGPACKEYASFRKVVAEAERPRERYALVVDQDGSEAVTIALTIRGALPDGEELSCRLAIPRERWDPFLLLALVEQYSGTMH